MWVFKTIIINTLIVEQARTLADKFGTAAQGMWVTPLSGTGTHPATHYISSGLIGDEFASMLESPQGLVDGTSNLGITIDFTTAEFLLNNSDISDDPPFEAMNRLGLKLLVD